MAGTRRAHRLVIVVVIAIVGSAIGIATARTVAAPGWTFAVDTGFDAAGYTALGWSSVVESVSLPGGGALVHLDRVDAAGSTVAGAVVHVTDSGALDRSFAPGAATPGVLELPPELVGGSANRITVLAGGGFFVRTRRYTAAGAVDGAFGSSGWITSNGLLPIETSDGHLLVVTSAFSGCTVYRVDAGGTIGTDVLGPVPSADRVVSRGSYANWGPAGARRSNPLVSLAALRVIQAAVSGDRSSCGAPGSSSPARRRPGPGR